MNFDQFVAININNSTKCIIIIIIISRRSTSLFDMVPSYDLFFLSNMHGALPSHDRELAILLTSTYSYLVFSTGMRCIERKTWNLCPICVPIVANFDFMQIRLRDDTDQRSLSFIELKCINIVIVDIIPQFVCSCRVNLFWT